MPIYAYKCPSCGAEREIMRSMRLAEEPVKCEKCPAQAVRVLSPAQIPPSRVQK
jgi:putative FmdB family regulatory protein